MSSLAEFYDRLRKIGLEYFGRYYGVYCGVVVELLEDSRVRVKVPQVSESNLPPATMWTPWGGTSHGMVFPPDVGDYVLISFEDGDVERPRYVGGWYSASDMPTDFVRESVNNVVRYAVRGVVTKTGLKLLFDDRSPFTIKLVHPTAVVTLTEQKVQIQTTAGGMVELDGTTIRVVGDVIELGASGLEPGVKGQALSTYLTTKLSVSTPMGPSGPASAALASGAELSTTVSIQ